MAGKRPLGALQTEIRSCRRCVDAGYAVVLPPVVCDQHRGQRAYLLGLAPGVIEAGEGRPWRGPAGRTLRRWLRMNEETFYATFYCASVTRCYPGEARGGRGDRTASAAERRLCSEWSERELLALAPALLVTVGAIAAREVLGLVRLADGVGKSFLLGDAVAVPLPHPSGASAWLNDTANRARLGKSLVHVRRELERIAS
jgi:uracil-DNA glycosylase